MIRALWLSPAVPSPGTRAQAQGTELGPMGDAEGEESWFSPLQALERSWEGKSHSFEIADHVQQEIVSSKWVIHMMRMWAEREMGKFEWGHQKGSIKKVATDFILEGKGELNSPEKSEIVQPLRTASFQILSGNGLGRRRKRCVDLFCCSRMPMSLAEATLNAI